MSNGGVEERKTSNFRLGSDHVIMLLLFVALAGTLGYAWYQHRSIGQLANSRDQLAFSLSQTRAVVDTMSAQLKEIVAAQKPVQSIAPPSAPAVAKQPARPARRSVTQHAKASRPPVEDPRWRKIDSEIAKTRSDLENSIKSSHDELDKSIASAHDELNGSIAKTHEELVALEQKGERNYYEFDLGKSKEFVRTGPIGISLRKANTKHRYCDLEVRVDDYQLSKKHVNLYEPVYLSPEGYPQPLELVINRIDKNHIKGYVSKPKYVQAEVATATPKGAESAAPADAPQKSQPVLLNPR